MSQCRPYKVADGETLDMAALGWGQGTSLPPGQVSGVSPNPCCEHKPCCKVGFDYLIKKMPPHACSAQGLPWRPRAGPKGGQAGANYCGYGRRAYPSPCADRVGKKGRLSEVDFQQEHSCVFYLLPDKTEHIAAPPIPDLSPGPPGTPAELSMGHLSTGSYSLLLVWWMAQRLVVSSVYVRSGGSMALWVIGGLWYARADNVPPVIHDSKISSLALSA